MVDSSFLKWHSYLVAMFVEQTLKMGFKRCKGCEENRLSPIAHAHITTSLIEKIRHFFTTIQSVLCEDIVELAYLARFIPQTKVKDFTDEELISEGLRFLKQLTPHEIYYGAYISKEDEVGFYDKDFTIPNELFVKKQSSVGKVASKKSKSDYFDELRTTEKVSRKKRKLNKHKDISSPSDDFMSERKIELSLKPLKFLDELS